MQAPVPSSPSPRGPFPAFLRSPGGKLWLQDHYHQLPLWGVEDPELKREVDHEVGAAWGGGARAQASASPCGSPRLQRAASRKMLSPFLVLVGSSARRFPMTCGRQEGRGTSYF